MNQNTMLIALLIGALLFLRPSGAPRMGNAQMTGGAGTGYGVDQWGDEG